MALQRSQLRTYNRGRACAAWRGWTRRPGSLLLLQPHTIRRPSSFLRPTSVCVYVSQQVLSKAGSTDLSQLLEYHVLPALRPVPTGWKNGESVTTLLAGHSIKAQLTQRCVCVMGKEGQWRFTSDFSA